MTIDDRLAAQDAPTVRVQPAETLTLGTEYLTMCTEALGCEPLTVTDHRDDPDALECYAVWDPESGDSPDEAAEDAVQTVRRWQR